jgi:hypothetical protein
MVSINGSTTVFQVYYSGSSTDCEKGTVDETDTNDQITDLNKVSAGESAFSPIPVISHIRSVSVDDNGTMFCTCKHFETRLAMCPSSKCSYLLSSLLKF